MSKTQRRSAPRTKQRFYYDPAGIVDAPEFHELSRALGILTWDTRDDGVRPVEERIRDFCAAFPPADPVSRTHGRLIHQPDGSYAPGSVSGRLQRFQEEEWQAGSLPELLARYGLKLKDGPAYVARPFVPGVFREAARKRNLKLRVLHGGVDIEAADMDAAKADFLERQEKQQAAQDVRAALKRMRDELEQ